MRKMRQIVNDLPKLVYDSKSALHPQLSKVDGVDKGGGVSISFRYKGDSEDVSLMSTEDRVQGLSGIELDSKEDFVSVGGQGSQQGKIGENHILGLVKCGICNLMSDKG
jgi:hypothetical protein